MNIHHLYAALGTRVRTKRMQEFTRVLQPADGETVLDVGGYPTTWQRFPRRVSVTSLTIYPLHFPPSPRRSRSNSVIEHLSTFERQQAFAAEARRVRRKL